MIDPFDAIMQHYNQGQFAQAKALLERELVARPKDAQVHGFMSIVLLHLGENAQAAEHAQHSSRLAPRSSDAWTWLGNANAALLRQAEALENFERALVFGSTNGAAWVGKMLSLRYLGRIYAAVKCGQQAMKKCSSDQRVVATYAAALLAAGMATEACSIARSALADWPDSLELASVLAGASNYTSSLSRRQVYESQLEYGRILARSHIAPDKTFPQTRDPVRRLKIGIVSSDFREHSVAYFIKPLLVHADRTECELYCYSTTAAADARTVELKRYADQWRDAANFGDHELSQLIYADGIDVLLDLNGHTVGHRLGVFFSRPAPVQATYCGYPNTTGIPAMNFRIVDAVTDPEGDADSHATERLMRLRGCFLCYAPPPVLRKPFVRADRPVTFGSFNALQKVSQQTVLLWKAALDAVPDSRLLVKAMLLREPELKRVFLAQFVDVGIESSRIEILEPSPDFTSHLELYHQVDVALDTVPYNGTTTTCEALLMGVPVLTLCGDRHAARVSVSLLTAAGYPQWVAQTPQEFAHLARTLTQEMTILASLRQSIPIQLANSPLCDGANFSSRFLSSVRDMWKQWCDKS